MSTLLSVILFTTAFIFTFTLPQDVKDIYFNKDDRFLCTEYKLPVNESFTVSYDSLADGSLATHVLLLDCIDSDADRPWVCRRICRSEEPVRFTWPSINHDKGKGCVVDAVSGTEYTPTEQEEGTDVRELLVYGADPQLQVHPGNDTLQSDTTVHSDGTKNDNHDAPPAVETDELNKDSSKSSMKDYWNEHSKDASMQEMMLDNDAEILSKDELPEILSYLPNYDNIDVVELGAGIGRFTTHLAQRARKVLAVDFMENFIEKNREINKNFTNIDYLAEDVMDLDLEDDDWDLVFSNWLYMYLDNDELTHFLRNTLAWLRPGGFMFCKESCLQQSGSKIRTINPTYYRDPLVYESLFASVTIPTEDGKAFYGFEKVFSKSVDTYIKMKNNDNQLVWLIQKVRRVHDTSDDFVSLRELKEEQKSEISRILSREELIGRGFIQTGGLDIAQMAAEMFSLQEGQKVLDLNCGIGGFGVHVAKTYDVEVTASDISSSVIYIARERAKEAGVSQQVKFEVASLERRIHAPESFDVIYGRDVIGEVKDKLILLRHIHDALKMGGKLLIADFCIDEEVEDIELDTDVFIEHHQNSNVPDKVLSTGAMLDLMTEAGFVNVSALDKTDDILRALERELTDVKEQSKAECLDTLTIRRQILNKLRTGNSWMMFYAEKQTK